MFVTLFQRKWGLHLSPQVAGSGAQARKFGGLRAPLTLFVKYEWVGLSGGGNGPEISPHTQRLNCINGQLLREAHCSRLYTTLSRLRVFLGHSPSPSLAPRCCCLLRQLRADHEHIGLLPPGTWVFPSRCGVSGSRTVGHGGSGRAETHGRCPALSPMCCGGLSGFLPDQPHGTQFLPGGKTFPAESVAVSLLLPWREAWGRHTCRCCFLWSSRLLCAPQKQIFCLPDTVVMACTSTALALSEDARVLFFSPDHFPLFFFS